MPNQHLVEQALVRFGSPASRERYFDLYSDDVALHGYGIEPGLANVKAYYAAIWTAFPDVTIQIDDLFETEDKVVARFTLKGTHQGPFRGLAATGRPIAVAGITILRFKDGKCVERWSATDALGLMLQVGAIQLGGG